MITLCVEGRTPRLGALCGSDDSHPLPWVNLTPLGESVKDEWLGIPRYYPQIRVLALTVMPDHLHGILFVTEPLPVHLGKVINGFKTGCNRTARELGLSVPVWEQGYTDGVLQGKGQLDRWKAYLSDNPRRLLIKRENPDFFSVQRNLKVSGMTFSAIGNRFLLERPVKLPVQCSRSITMEDLEKKKRELLAAAAQGAVLVSPAIAAGEKGIMRAAFDAGYPEIILLENGFTDLAKPGGARFDACSRGQLLLLAPWDHHNEHITIRREQCQILNTMTHQICE